MRIAYPVRAVAEGQPAALDPKASVTPQKPVAGLERRQSFSPSQHRYLTHRPTKREGLGAVKDNRKLDSLSQKASDIVTTVSRRKSASSLDADYALLWPSVESLAKAPSSKASDLSPTSTMISSHGHVTVAKRRYSSTWRSTTLRISFSAL